MQNIAIFASGKGSNAEIICRFFMNHVSIRVSCIFSNNQFAGVHDVAKKYNIPSVYFRSAEADSAEKLLSLLNKHNVDFIILAGYLKPVPPEIIIHYPGRILNIHPALLPKFGGKGMYGKHVHEAVYSAGETESGITIHLVNDKYDDGKIIFQAKTTIGQNDTPQQIADKVLTLEHHYYSGVIENYITEFKSKMNRPGSF